MKYIGIVGSRRRNGESDYSIVDHEFLKIYEPGDIIVSGGCPSGADHFAELIAKKYGITIKIFYSDWEKYGKIAGFIRNTDIAKTSDVLIACVSSDRKGGTEDTINKFKKSHIVGRVILC